MEIPIKAILSTLVSRKNWKSNKTMTSSPKGPVIVCYQPQPPKSPGLPRTMWRIAFSSLKRKDVAQTLCSSQKMWTGMKIVAGTSLSHFSYGRQSGAFCYIYNYLYYLHYNGDIHILSFRAYWVVKSFSDKIVIGKSLLIWSVITFSTIFIIWS